MKKIIRQESGMTLVELLVSLVISSFIIAGVYGVYTVQKKSYTVQEQVAEMQQRLRSAMDFLARDIRMAGSNPAYEAACSDGYKIIKADAQEMIFRACNFEDENNDGVADDTDYEITIKFDPNSSEPNILHLTRDRDMNGATSIPIADGVDQFEIQYISGYTPSGDPIPAPVATPGDRDNIRIVKISMLIRSTYPDRKYTDTNQYVMGSGATWIPPANDHFHRRLLITTIELRNM